MPRTKDAAGECDSSNATLCKNCSKALQKPLVCARCKTHLLFQGLPGAHSTQKTGRPCNKGCHRL